MNTLIIKGHVVADAKLFTTPGKMPLLRFSVASNTRFKNAAGETKDSLCFQEVAIWGNRATALAQYMHKSKPVLLKGRLQTESWNTQTGKRHVNMLVVDTDGLDFLDKAPSNPAPQASQPPQPPQAPLDPALEEMPDFPEGDLSPL
ncbi:MAG: single-stranded DNA-binding protein [Planctomycetaceae bacterium]|nr:single-stranded DNA-binding protein [Planctomycetaceae bacterium]